MWTMRSGSRYVIGYLHLSVRQLSLVHMLQLVLSLHQHCTSLKGFLILTCRSRRSETATGSA